MQLFLYNLNRRGCAYRPMEIYAYGL